MVDKIYNSKILFQNSYHPFPHLETELEIIEKLLSQNNIVFYLKCDRNLKSCFANPNNRYLTCKTCTSRVNNGIFEIQNKNLIIIDYNLYSDLSIENYNIEASNYELSTIKKIQYNNYDLGMAVFSSLVSYTRDHEPNLLLYKDLINRLIVSGKFLFDFSNRLLRENIFDYVFIFNGRFNENRPLLRACQNLKINYFTHERAGTLNRYLLRFNDIPHSIEASINEIDVLWNKNDYDRINIGESFFVKRIHKIEESWYSFTKLQKSGLLPNNFDQKNFNITIFNSSLDEYEGLVGFGSSFYKNDNEGIKKICENLNQFNNIKLYLRVHPNLRNLNNSQIQYIKNELSKLDNLTIINAEEEIDTYHLMNKSDLILTFGSTIGIEAAFQKKTVFLLGRASYENLECIYKPFSHEDLIDKIINFHSLSINMNNDSIKYGYWQEKQGIEFSKCKPLSVSSGLYKGKFINSNLIFSILEKVYNKIVIFFTLFHV